MLADAWARATLDALGWDGATRDPEELRRVLRIAEKYRPLLGRLVARAGVPEAPPGDPEALAERFAVRHPAGAAEVALLRRAAPALPEVLRGRLDPAEILTGAAPAYVRGSESLRTVREAVAAVAQAVGGSLPADGRLRVLELAGGALAASVAPRLPAGRFDYLAAAGGPAGADWAEDLPAEVTRGEVDLERDSGSGLGPGWVQAGVLPHGFDLVLAGGAGERAADLAPVLRNCRRLLAPSGMLVALDAPRAGCWFDLTLGLREGGPARTAEEWRSALGAAGFDEVEMVDLGWRGLVLARAPADVPAASGVWLLAGSGPAGRAAARGLAARLGECGRNVLVAGDAEDAEVRRVEAAERDSWRALVEEVASGAGLAGVVHLGGGSGWEAESRGSALELKEELTGSLGSALALAQGLDDAGVSPGSGVWLVTRGGQVVGGESGDGLAGSALWGFGRAAARELAALGVRLVDLDPSEADPLAHLVGELLAPDGEAEVVYREGRRRRARLVRSGGRTELPSGGGWRLARDPGGSLAAVGVEAAPVGSPGPGAVRVTVEASGLNFLDVMLGMGLVDVEMPLGGEVCGRVAEVGAGVTEFAAGGRVFGFAAGGGGRGGIGFSVSRRGRSGRRRWRGRSCSRRRRRGFRRRRSRRFRWCS